MKIDPHAYNISVRRGRFDGEVLYEARVKELPDLLEYGETFADAYDLAVDSIATAAAAYADQGRAFPDAQLPVDDFSGRVTLRIPQSLHRALAETAQAEGVSLNQHLVNVLSYFSGFAAGLQAPAMTVPWRPIPKANPYRERKRHLSLIRCEEFPEPSAAAG